jgi:hypothetical protein
MNPTNKNRGLWIILSVLIFTLIFLLGREAMKPTERNTVTLSAEAQPSASAAPLQVPPEMVEQFARMHRQASDAGNPEPAPPTWQTVKPEDYPSLVGKWVGEDSDAIVGGKLVVGGARVEIVADRPGSKTPFNIHFRVPRKGDDSTTSEGGCGFDGDSDAFCRGYGIDGEESKRTKVTFQRLGLRLRVTVSGLFTVDLLPDGEQL